MPKKIKQPTVQEIHIELLERAAATLENILLDPKNRMTPGDLHGRKNLVKEIHAALEAKPEPLRAFVKVEGGMPDVYRVPPGVVVELIDHDMDSNPEEENPNACRCKEGGGTYHSHTYNT